MKTHFVLLLFLLVVASNASITIAQSPGAFTPAGNMTTSRASHTASLLANGRVLIAGGVTESLLLASAELYDPSKLTFSATGNMTTPRAGHSATSLPDGRVLIAGGGTFALTTANSELYDPSTGTFTATGSMSANRGSHTATLLNNGKVLIAGGSGNGSILYSAEVYDPSTGTFTSTHDMTTSRSRHTATLLPNGEVLIAGGFGGGGPVVGNELYDPETGTFRLTGETPQSSPSIWCGDASIGGVCAAATATLLGNGKVLTTFLADDRPGDTAALYDPSNGTFTTTGTMNAPRNHTATLLPDGTVLVAGVDWAYVSKDADIYDPRSGTFSATGNMVTYRYGHAATLLPDGTVLISGGRFPFVAAASILPGPLATAELYHPAVLATAPVLLSLSGDGRVQGAIQHGDTYRLVTADNPAVAGDIIVIYCTGLSDGSLIPPQVFMRHR